jgi:hypothetical protein
MKDVVVCDDPALRDGLAGLATKALVRHCAGLALLATTDLASATLYTLRLLAQRIQQLSVEITHLNEKLTSTIARYLLIAAGDNADRLVSEGSFAALCGTSPVEASSARVPQLMPSLDTESGPSAAGTSKAARAGVCPGGGVWAGQGVAGGPSSMIFLGGSMPGRRPT